MKKRLIGFITILLFFLVLPLAISAETNEPTRELKIHYHRYNNDYNDGWNVWLWPDIGDGFGVEFERDGSSDVVLDEFGAIATVDLTTFNNLTTMGIIIRQRLGANEWNRKDVDKDRFIPIPTTSPSGTLHVYLAQSEELIGYSASDIDISDKITQAYFKTNTQISFTLTKTIDRNSITLTADGNNIDGNITISGTTGTFTMSSAVDLTKSYVLNADFGEGIKSYDVTFDGIYDSEEFENAFGYDGELGVTVETNKTTFRLWAPISTSVTLNIYNTGTVTTDKTPVSTHEMERIEKGAWEYVASENLHGKYYTYTVTNGNKINEVVDPYAKSTGVNGLRGMVVDFSKTNPTGYKYERASNITNPTDAIVYELHVRDLTSHSSWGGPEEYAGKFMGFTVDNTKYTKGDVTVSTGLSHLKELGITHVQLLPIFDFGVIDETNSDNDFNWGYMPLNFNTLEGSYSTDPYDGAVRINEFKQLVQSLHNNNINIIMDVVYNHTGQSGDSNFSLILPGYYHRMVYGSFSNGSGTGNETASERYMMRKFMVDSVKFLATEYSLSGFRFDLMALHDVTTMNEIAEELRKIDPNILIYGEPWTGGTTPLSSNIAADKVNLEDMQYVGAFNDEIRDGIKGSVFGAADQGFIQGNTSDTNINKIKYGIVGGVDYPGLNKNSLSYQMAWGKEPTKTINYVSAHDNNTLYDKLRLSVDSNTKKYVLEMQKQANAIVLTSQGIPFLHAGVDFMRSKPKISGGYDENSYESPDSTNQLRWDQKAKEDNLDCFNYYKNMIKLRKDHPAFRMTSSTDIKANLSFIDTGTNDLIAYKISNNANNDSWDNILVLHNTCKWTTFTFPEGNWTQYANLNTVGENIATYKGGDQLYVLQNETLIFYDGITNTDKPVKTGCGCNSNFAIIPAMLLSLVALAFIKRKH